MAFGLPAAFRLVRAGFLLARAGIFSSIDAEALPTAPRTAVRLARRLERREAGVDKLVEALHELGPSYIKLGQFLATRPDLVGRDLALALGRLRDEIPPFPRETAVATIAAALDRDIDEVFVDLSEPVAAASIAQVHRARLAVAPVEVASVADALLPVLSDGDTAAADPPETKSVAVKVIRPGARDLFRKDLKTFYAGARLIEALDPAARRLRPVAVVDTLARSIAIEMDFRLEGAALSELSANTAGDAGFRAPAVNWEFTARDVLTMEWIDGVKLSDTEALLAAGHDLQDLARRLMQAFLRQALRDGFFHADMHQGNFFVEADGSIVAVDFGIMGRLGRAERRFLAEILLGFIERDYRRVAQVHFDAGYVPPNHAVEDFAQALRAIGEPIHGQSARDISMGRLLTLLFEVTEIFDMQTRPELLLLQKTMVVVEGVSRSLDPEFDMWSASEPVVREWIERNLGPVGQIENAAIGLSAFARLASDLPRLAERAERLAGSLDGMSERPACANGSRLLWAVAVGALLLALLAL